MVDNMTQIPQNYVKQVEWVYGAYEDAGVSLPEGFQKDSIQNATGARKHNSWDNWACEISLVSNEKGNYLIVEDFGTVGLTGDNIASEEIQKFISNGGYLDTDQRLARFTSMNNSGGNQSGGGLYGVGKIVYAVASQNLSYYFDSLREDGKYVANANIKGQVYSQAFEGNKAMDFIEENTGLSEKTTAGTRIIIENPKKEIIESIDSGKLEKYIQKTWWIILERMGNTAHISVNGKKIEVPEGIKNYKHNYVLTTPENFKPNYRVKNFGLFISDDGNNIWEGISYYRKGMQIGQVDLKVVPEKVKGKYWGYVEVDEDWESALAEIEDKVHFGVSKGKKLTLTYQNLKNYCSNKFRQLLIEWGYIKDKEHENKKLKERLDLITESVQDLFDSLGFEDLGTGPEKSDFDVRWKNILYPSTGIERVTTNDKINFTMRITSSYLTQKRFEYSLAVVEPETKKIISQIDAGTISMNPDEEYEKSFIHVVTKSNSEQYKQNRIILKVNVIGSGKEKVKMLPYFYDIDKPDNSKRQVTLSLYECTFPNQGSRRVNFGESLQDIKYRIENKCNDKLSYRLNVSIHNASDVDCPKIQDICSLFGEVKPYEAVVLDAAEHLMFEEPTYKMHLDKGILELRARLSAAEDSGDFEKGDKVTRYHYKIYLNCDEKHGKKDSFIIKSVDLPDVKRRAWYDNEGNERIIYLNIGHYAYTFLSDYPEEVQFTYLEEQVMKQYILLYLAEGKYDMFSDGKDKFQDLDPMSAAERVMDKIEDVYYEKFIAG